VYLIRQLARLLIGYAADIHQDPSCIVPATTMVGRYIPPHKRNQSSEENPVKPERDPEDGYWLEEVLHQLDCQKPGTLSYVSTATDSNWPNDRKLAVILLYNPKNQHPQWPWKIFCKRNLDLLPDVPAPEKENEAPADKGVKSDIGPIPVFSEKSSTFTFVDGRRNGNFVFEGFHKIVDVVYLQPESEELIDMLKTRKCRARPTDAKLKWAVVNLKKAEDSLQKNPMVAVQDLREKAVNKLLEGSRSKTLGNQGEGENEGDGNHKKVNKAESDAVDSWTG